jgi:hypothetical protein
MIRQLIHAAVAEGFIILELFAGRGEVIGDHSIVFRQEI